jgi:hypothetical protein
MIQQAELRHRTLTALIGLISSVALTACHSHPGISDGPPIKPAQGWTSGGGNATAARVASEQEIRTAITKAQYWLPYIFNAIGFDTISMATDPVQPAGDNYKKLFGDTYGAAPIQTALQKMTVRLEEKNACLSPLGQEDGAAYTDGSICISLARLKGKLSSDTVFVEIASLLGREASHLVGFSESDAALVQQKIRTTVHEELADLDGPQSLIAAFETPSWVSYAAWNAVNSVKSAQSDGAICVALGDIFVQHRALVDGFQKAAKSFGAWPISSVDYEYYSEALWFKSKVIVAEYCGGSQYDNDAIQRIFSAGTRQDIETADLQWMKGSTYHSLYDNPRHRPMTDVFVQKVSPADHAALIKELLDVQTIANEMTSDIAGRKK